MEKENVLMDLKSESSSFMVHDYTPKNTILSNILGSEKSSLIKDENFEYNSHKYYDLKEGTPSANAESWFG